MYFNWISKHYIYIIFYTLICILLILIHNYNNKKAIDNFNSQQNEKNNDQYNEINNSNNEIENNKEVINVLWNGDFYSTYLLTDFFKKSNDNIKIRPYTLINMKDDNRKTKVINKLLEKIKKDNLFKNKIMSLRFINLELFMEKLNNNKISMNKIHNKLNDTINYEEYIKLFNNKKIGIKFINLYKYCIYNNIKLNLTFSNVERKEHQFISLLKNKQIFDKLNFIILNKSRNNLQEHNYFTQITWDCINPDYENGKNCKDCINCKLLNA